MAELVQDNTVEDVQVDRPLPEVQTTPVSIDAPLPEVTTQKPESVELDNIYVAQAASIDSYLTGTDIGESYTRYANAFRPQDEVVKLSAQKAQEDSSAITEEYVNNPTAGGFDVGINAIAASQAKQQALRDADDPDRQAIESMTNTPEAAMDLEYNVGKMKLYRMLAEDQATVSFAEEAGSVLGSMVPFVDTITQTILTGSLFNTKEIMESAIMKYKNSPIEDQITMYPVLRDTLKDHFGEAGGVNTLAKFIVPSGEEDLAEFHLAWKALDVVDVIGVGAAIKKFHKGRTLIKVLEETGNKAEAVSANVASAIEETTAASMNTTKHTATSSMLPFDMDELDLAVSKNMSADSIVELETFFKQVDETAEDIIHSKGYLKEGIVSDEDRVLAEAETLARFKKAGHEGIHIIEQGEGYTKFGYRTADEDGNLLDEVFEMDLTLDAVGDWSQTTLTPGSENIASPTVWAKGSTRLDVNTAQRLDYTTSKIDNQLKKSMAEAIKPLGSLFKPTTKGRMAKIDKALLEGDVYKRGDETRGKLFTPDELVAHYQLDEAEIQTYYRLNRVFNNLFNIANATKRNEMVALNYKNINLGGESRSYGKVQDTANTGLESLRKAEASYIYDSTTDSVRKATGTDGWLDDLYDEGKVLVHLGENYKTKANFVGEVKFALVNRTEVGDLPPMVLNRKTAYVPRIYDEATYFVKELVPTKIEGKNSHTPNTLRFFNNKVDAEKYRSQLVDELVANGKVTREAAEAKYIAIPDREVETVSGILSDFSKGSGGLYTAARSQDDILFGLNGTEAVRVNAFDSLVRNIGSVSRASSMNEWRMGLEQKWINSVNNYLGSIGAQGRVTSFGGAPKSIEGSEAGAFFAKMEKQIREWQGFPSKEEQIWRTGVQRTMNWAADLGMGEKGVSVIGSARSADPISAARGLAFHSLLGAYNPAHLWIQAQGASVALSLAAGKYAGKVTRNVAAMTALGEGTIKDGVRFKLAATAGADSADELKEIHSLWKKTGLGDTVLQTADHAAAVKGFGVVGAAVRKAADQGLLFYRNGELTSRRTAFLTAIERYKETKGVSSVKGMSDKDLKSVFDDTNNMMLNMSKANRAGFQKGIFSVPTQFLQVTTKSFESTLGLNKNFTKAESGRILFGQLALYGAAGIPLASVPIHWALEAGGYTQAELDASPELVKGINDGFWGVVSHWMLGADIELASRGSLIRGGTDLVDRILSAEGTMAGTLLGAAGTTGQRVWDGFAKQMRPITYGVHELSPIDVVKIPTLGVLSGISSWRNGNKAVIMNALHHIADKNGNIVVQEDFNLATEVATAIGFQPSKEGAVWDLKERDEHIQSTKKLLANMALNLMNDYALTIELGRDTEEGLEEFNREMAFISQVMGNPVDNQEVSKMIQNRILSDSKYEMAVSRQRNRLIEGLADGISGYRALLGDKIIILDNPNTQKED